MTQLYHAPAGSSVAFTASGVGGAPLALDAQGRKTGVDTAAVVDEVGVGGCHTNPENKWNIFGK